MSDDPQPPAAPGNTEAYRPTLPGDAAGDPWPAPAGTGRDEAAPRVDLGKPGGAHASAGPDRSGAEPHPGSDPWAPPPNGTQAFPSAPGGPGDTLASNGPVTWSSPSVPAVHDQQTITSMPGAGAPAAAPQPSRPWADPYALPHSTAAASGSANPFAPPAAPQSHGEPVPPPPIAPDGPGQVPYGYPGGPADYAGPHAQGYYGWPGPAPLPHNGMGTAGLVLGIIAAAVFCLWPLAIVVGVLGVIFGAIGRKKARRGEATNPGQALAGIICGAAGIVLGIGLGVLVIATR